MIYTFCLSTCFWQQQSVREGDQMIVNASFHVTHWSVQPFGTGLSKLKFVGKKNYD